ncbi:MAG: hypothetical protein IKB32_04815, partial [Clostridia bacterium]|nr:hypothetical protein [Clostridia bacterium]
MKTEKVGARVFFNSKRRYIRLSVYAVILFALGLVLAANKRPEAIFEIALTVGIIAFEVFHVQKSQKEFLKYTQHLDFCLNDNSRGSLLNYPAPLIITDMDGKINWYNDWFRLAVDEEDIYGRDVHQLIPDISISKLLENDEKSHIKLTIGENHYEIWGNVVGGRKGQSDSLVV